MSCVWLSTQECSKVEIFHLTELVKGEADMQIVISFDAPGTKVDKMDLQRRLDDLLSKIGIRSNLRGWQYLRTAVQICLEDREELDGVTKRLYPSVAKAHKTTADIVEQAIRHAIEVSWKNGNAVVLEEALGYRSRNGRRPANTEFICMLTDYIEDGEQPLYS